MKVIGITKDGILLHCTKDEWRNVARAAGVAWDKSKGEIGEIIDTKQVETICDNYRGLVNLRKEMNALNKKWNAFSDSMDKVLASEEKV